MLHSIVGYMNSGKTLFMTLKGFEDYKKGRVIYSNYPLNFPHYLINKDYIMNLGKEQPNLFNTTFLLDEFWIWFDSRKSAHNTLASNFILQSSKQDTSIYMTTQDTMQNDVRIRKNQHYITICDRKVLSNGKLKKIDNAIRILPEKIQPYIYINFRTYSFKFVGLQRVLTLFQSGNIRASPIFSLYDTHRKVKAE